ncbi:exodeoxyribonuclease III [Bacterioplanoides sp. SCSIO 12839]|uniref:exodeoxyribonuclease III n=1 Tax=Bacterioplanoides sp. SCSIO 12839 TaxID=2829569 RepID=UPI002107B2FD|nr:exodeoxyribonuclease III [Bacterioplanoides sp. SCSIO 12839]UTW47914.1 exodeoxyribonuclease III [Bacterioplanoides sp. SCSIO 12839]
MRIISLHVDGLAQAVEKGLYEWLKTTDADVIAIQNLKAKEYQLPDDVVYPDGFNAYFFDAEADHYSGVAILTKHMPKAIMTGLAFPQCDMQGRFIQADFDHVSVGSILFPAVDEHNTLEDKLAFQQAFLDHLSKTRRKRREFIFCGNFEAAHKTIDLGDWKANQQTPGFLPEERAWFDQMFGPTGYVDAFREANFGENQFTWWPDEDSARRNQNGWRKDMQICTPNIRQYVVEAKIDNNLNFGDHAAVMIEYEFDED